MTNRRSATAQAAGDAILAMGRAPTIAAGFDGFLDEILRVVDVRHSMAEPDFTPITTIQALADRIGRAAGRSMNLEFVLDEVRAGGNGPLCATALAALGARVSYAGAIADPAQPDRVHPAFAPFAARCDVAIPLAPPGVTECLEFADGKIMFNRPQPLRGVTWPILASHPLFPAWLASVRCADLLVLVNWTLTPAAEELWIGLLDSTAIPPGAGPRRVFVDLTDPAKRTDADLVRALALLTRMNARWPVTLGLNLAEALRVGGAVGLPSPPAGWSCSTTPELARGIRQAAQLACVVIHPREGAAASDADGTPAFFEGPAVRHPRISTGAGDHFNAGFAFAQALGLPLEHALAVGVALSGYYVRSAKAPDRHALAGLLKSLPTSELEIQ